MSFPNIISFARNKLMTFWIRVRSAYRDKQVAALFFSVDSYVGKADPHKLLVEITCPKEPNIGIRREDNHQTQIAWKLSYKFREDPVPFQERVNKVSLKFHKARWWRPSWALG